MKKVNELKALVRVGKIILSSIPRKKIENNLSKEELTIFRDSLFDMGSAVRDNMGKLFNITGNPDYLLWET